MTKYIALIAMLACGSAMAKPTATGELGANTGKVHCASLTDKSFNAASEEVRARRQVATVFKDSGSRTTSSPNTAE
jgi:hypothetical protein